jgi:NAD-dependent protein deacetylases, SIR2 family
MLNLVVLTGAGVSAESGIPTFRGKEGLWKNFKPEELATPEGGCSKNTNPLTHKSFKAKI